MDEDYIQAMNEAADYLISVGRSKEEVIENCRIWLDNWEISDDD